MKVTNNTQVSIASVTHARAAAAGAAAEDYTVTAMKNIRSLQKQLQTIGEHYQDELAHPKTAGSQEQEILREILHQMDSVQREIDALQQSVIEHQAIEQLKKDKNTSLKIPNPDLDAALIGSANQTGGADGVPSKVKAAAEPTSSNSPDTPTKPTKVDPTRLVGSVIDTTA